MLGADDHDEMPEKRRFRKLQRQMSESKLLTHSAVKSIAVSFLDDHRKEVGNHDISMEDMLFGTKEKKNNARFLSSMVMNVMRSLDPYLKSEELNEDRRKELGNQDITIENILFGIKRKKNNARFTSMVMNVMRSLDPCLSSEEIVLSRRCAPLVVRRSSLGAVSVASSLNEDNGHKKSFFSIIQTNTMSRHTPSYPAPDIDMCINLAPRRGEWGRSHSGGAGDGVIVTTRSTTGASRKRSLGFVISPSSAGELLSKSTPAINIIYDDSTTAYYHVPCRRGRGSMSGLTTNGILSALTEEVGADDE
jgi:hypothetical protein